MATLSVPAVSNAWLDYVDVASTRTLGIADLRGAALHAAVARVSHAYTRERDALSDLLGDDEALCARLKFFLSRDLLKIHGPLAELASLGALPSARSWRVLDLGAGLGATSLGVARFAALSASAQALEICAIDYDPAALELFAQLASDATVLPAPPLRVETHALDLTRVLDWLAATARPRFDLIVIGLALNELHASAPQHSAQLESERLIKLASHLSDDGALIVIEPALRETSRRLHAVRDVLVQRNATPYVFAPCLRRGGCPMLARERDFCHERLPSHLPERLATIARGAGLRDEGLTYSYLTLRAQPRNLRELASSGTLYRTVSAPLRSKGKLELWLCGDDDATRAMRLERHESSENTALGQAGRGSILRVEHAQHRPTDRQAWLRIEPTTSVELLQSWQEE